jgi:hypothetical protein
VRPLREEPERVDRAERELRPLRLRDEPVGPRDDGLLPVRADALGAVAPVADAEDTCSASPHTLQ